MVLYSFLVPSWQLSRHPPLGQPLMGDRFLSSAGAGKNCALSMRVPNSGPVLDKNAHPPLRRNPQKQKKREKKKGGNPHFLKDTPILQCLIVPFSSSLLLLPSLGLGGGGGIYGWAGETGTICQVGISTGKRCIFWAKKGYFRPFRTTFSMKAAHYSIAIFVVRNHRKWPFLGSKNAPFCCNNANLPHWARFTRLRKGGVVVV